MRGPLFALSMLATLGAGAGAALADQTADISGRTFNYSQKSCVGQWMGDAELKLGTTSVTGDTLVITYGRDANGACPVSRGTRRAQRGGGAH